MFEADDNQVIHVTRGNVGALKIKAEYEDGDDYIFNAGDVLRLKVFSKGNCEDVVLQKTVEVLDDGYTSVNICFRHGETKIGEPISKPFDYWYEVELNPDTEPMTIIGYDKNGPKIFKLYPEGGERNGDING